MVKMLFKQANLIITSAKENDAMGAYRRAKQLMVLEQRWASLKSTDGELTR